MMQIEQITALEDNYIYLLLAAGKTAVIDPSTASPVLTFLEKRRLKLDFILTTHHHWDHVGGNLELKSKTGCRVVGFSNDAHRIPGIDEALSEGDTFLFGDTSARILFIPGHTLGHIAYYFEQERALFCGDTLFSLGCGRLFEGTPEQMFQSLTQLKKLPQDTRVFCGHEYTLANSDFALSIDPQNTRLKSMAVQVAERRQEGLSTIPSLLGEEMECNPFLTATTLAEFTERRRLKDTWH